MRIGPCWHCKIRTEVRRVVLYVAKPYKKMISRDMCIRCISELEREIEQKERENSLSP